MIGFLFLSLAVTVSAIKGVVGKKVSQKVTCNADSLLFSMVRLLLCIIVATAILFIRNAQKGLAVSTSIFLISLLAGFSNVGFIVLWTLAVRKNPYVTVDVAIIVGSIIPSVASAIFIPGYVFSYLKLIGFAFLIAAAVFMGKYTASTVKKITFSSIILVVLTGLSEGIFSFSQQLYKAFGKTDLYTEEVFGFYTYLLSAGILSVLIIFYFIFFIKKEDFVPTVKGFAERTGSVVGLLFILAAFLYANSYFQTLATTVGKLDPQILYPVYRGSLLILAMILSRIIFKEKITVNSVIGIICAIAGIVLMNLL